MSIYIFPNSGRWRELRDLSLRRQEGAQEWCGNLGWRMKDWIIERRDESVGNVGGRRGLFRPP